MNTSPPSIDDIILRVKAQAQQQAASVGPDTGAPPFTPQPQYQPADVPPPGETLPEQPELHREAYYLEELLLEDGDAFVRAAYRALLGRDADPTGLQGYRSMLVERGKLAVLDSLHRSGEGQQHNTAVHGAALPFALFRLQRWLRRRLGRSLGVGRALQVLERHYAHKLVAAQRVLARMAAERRQLEAELAAIDVRVLPIAASTEAYLATLLELKEAQLAGRRDLALLRVAHSDQQRQADRLLQELAGFGQAQPQAAANLAQGHLADKIDLYYRAFEDANRGSLEQIRAKLAGYLPRFAALRQSGLAQPVLDIGCGRGEWLQLLREHGLAACGVDLNPVMVAVCAEQGLEAAAGDAYAHLKTFSDNSLAAITGFHIVEHLPFETLYGIFEQAFRVLEPGGLILFETPNPENVLVGSHTFYHDFSHRNPVTPTGISFLAHYHQFEAVEIERLNPYPPEAQVSGNDALTARVNGTLCGPQDFALIARKPLFTGEPQA